jgi:hypothetical protein
MNDYEDLLDWQQDDDAEAETERIVAFGDFGQARLEALEAWFEREFGVGMCCFLTDSNGKFDALRAMQRDAYREVWLRIKQEVDLMAKAQALVSAEGKEVEP